ncbi:MAG: hypothetical protein R2695_13445 [Acidimicrobiales bacterium]
MARVPLPGGTPRLIARSQTAEVRLDTVVVGPDGFGMTITITSLGDWVLPPAWETEEYLSPGVGAEHRLSPDVVTIDVAYEDGTLLSNRDGPTAGAPTCPDPVPSSGWVPVGSSTTATIAGRPPRHVETTEWWAWPLPLDGAVTVQVLARRGDQRRCRARR